MQLGAFSVSLAVKDIEASRQFYEKLGFTKFAGLTISVEADESTSGPAHFMLADPDGNTILVDQHV